MDGNRRRLSLLLVINGTDFGGTESALAQIAVALAKRGHDIDVVSLKPTGRIGERMHDAGIRVSSLDLGEVVTPASLLLGIERMRRWMKGRRFDLIQSFLPRANIITRVANQLVRPRLPHISSERSTDFNRSPAVARLTGLTSRWTDRVLAISPAVRDVLVRRDGVPPSLIDILENGIDVARVDDISRANVRETMEGFAAGDLLLCAVGRLVKDKGHDYLIEALARGSARTRVHLALVGEGPYEPRLRKMAKAHRLDHRVHFLGFRSDVISILKDVDIVALPSLEEGVPVVLLEAMACRTPIVATTVGGVPDLVEDGRSALLVPPAEDWATCRDETEEPRAARRERAVAALSKALDRLADDPGLRDSLAAEGRARVESIFALDIVLDRLEGYYASVLEGARRSPPAQPKALQRPVATT